MEKYTNQVQNMHVYNRLNLIEDKHVNTDEMSDYLKLSQVYLHIINPF